MYLCIHIIKYVYKGADETSPLIHHFCRASANETLPTVVLPGTSAWVRVVLVPQLPMSGFQMRYRRTGLFRFSHSTSMTRKLAVAEKPRVALSPYCKCWYLQYYWMSLMLQTLYIINVKKLFSLDHSVRTLNQTSKTAQIILARTLDWTHWLPLHT